MESLQDSKMIYLDNNATTIMPPNVIQQITAWMNKGNPSASYKSAQSCRKLMQDFRRYIASQCGVTSYELKDDNTPPNYTKDQMKSVYQFIFTSCASESNNFIVRSVAAAYRMCNRKIPHIVTSTIEHKSLLRCCTALAEQGLIELTLVEANKMGFIDPDVVRRAIKPNTCLISIMSANNETGAINDIKAIGQIAHKHLVPFHTDCVQTFGKFKLDPLDCNVDAWSVSFHKLHGPAGVGLIAIKRAFVEGFQLQAEICGTQNNDLRGGTENIMGIAGSYEALKHTWRNRSAKNAQLMRIKKYIMDELAQQLPAQTYREYLENPTKYAAMPVYVVFISLPTANYLPNTIFLSFVRNKEPLMCNVNLKKCLEKNNIIVSVGSACNTASSKASHVLDAIGADMFIKKGALRISMPDDMTKEMASEFIKKIVEIVNECVVGK